MEDDLKFLEMEDDLKYFHIFCLFKWKTPQFVVNKIIMQPETFQIETMVVAPLRVTLFVTIIMIFVLCSDCSIVIGYPGVLSC